MGNDGGSIPTRRELVKEAARNPNTSELKATLHEAQTHAWTYCPLSNQPLITPIVSDCAGTLYNKDAILEQLLPKDDDVPASVIKEKEEVLQGRVKGLRDIVEVKFSMVKEDKEEKKICPITNKELGAGTRAVYLVPCGHAFSEVAIKELKGDTCVECNEGYTAENIISILPVSKEEISKLAARAAKLKEGGLTHSLKKAPGGKKKRKHAAESESATPVNGGKEDSIEKIQYRSQENGLTDKTKAQIQENRHGAASTPKLNSGSSTPVPSGIKNASAANLTAKVLEEQEERNKRRKLGMNDNLKSLFSNTGYNAQKQKGGDFMTRGFSMNKKS
ncbi:Replication termination factor 2 [Ciborinia camelliae]|nr:Replication termination factor 2 [Ciborinia camelliae]